MACHTIATRRMDRASRRRGRYSVSIAGEILGGEIELAQLVDEIGRAFGQAM